MLPYPIFKLIMAFDMGAYRKPTDPKFALHNRLTQKIHLENGGVQGVRRDHRRHVYSRRDRSRPHLPSATRSGRTVMNR